jgi:hypothetical protein
MEGLPYTTFHQVSEVGVGVGVRVEVGVRDWVGGEGASKQYCKMLSYWDSTLC